MENASKALLMAAEILLGIMILSVIVYVFNQYGSYSKETNDKIADVQIAEFNSQFLKYQSGTDADKQVLCTIHDIASLANLAKSNNDQYEVTLEGRATPASYYVQIDIGNRRNIELYNNNDMTDLIKNNSMQSDNKTIKYYRCATCDVSETTKRVYYVKFVEI